MDYDYRPRSRSQSRQPPPHDDDQFRNVPLDRTHRSKSLDNRREFQREEDAFYDPPAGGFRDTFHASIPKRHYERRFGGGGAGGGDDERQGGGRGDDFFNETITIPRSTVKVSPTKMDKEKAELDWQSYDKSSRWHHERTAYPPPPPPQYPQQQYYRYDEHAYGGGAAAGGGGVRQDHLHLPPPPQAEISPRSYPESDYYQRAQIQRDRDRYYDGRSADAASAYRIEQRFYEEERERAERAERERAERVIREQREAEERSRHEKSGGKSAKNGHSQSYAYQYQSSGYSRGGGGGGGTMRGGRRAGKPERQYHRITCCCFRFYWPPWGFEPVEPIQPWYPRPSRPGSPAPTEKQQHR